MNYEEKYKEMKKRVLAIGQGYVKEVDYSSPRSIAEYIDPDLKESEDERIRKELIEYLKQRSKSGFNQEVKICNNGIAWLEKQDGQENLCDKCRKEQPSHSCQDITALGRCALEKQGEQKPVECIKFDNEFENQISHLIASVLNGEYEYNEGFVKYASQSLLGFAKKKQKPVEWSEEDEKKLQDVIYWFEIFCEKNQTKPEMKESLDWLKSLKPNHWKPSEEQGLNLDDLLGKSKERIKEYETI